MPHSGVRLETPAFPEERVTAFFGMPGSGKTTLSRLRALRFPRVLYLDSQTVDGEGEYPGVPAGITPQVLLSVLQQRMNVPKWRVSYRGPVPDALFWAFAGIKNLLLVVEEADKYGTGVSCPDGLYAMAHHGRRRGQALTLCSRRPANISKSLTAVIEGMYVWPVEEPADREYYRKRGAPLDILETLGEHETLRRFTRGPTLRGWYFCKCRSPHLGGCQKVSNTEEDTENAEA